MTFSIHCGTLVLPDRLAHNMRLAVEHGRIVDIGPINPNSKPDYDAGQHIVAPGFVDIHVHGARHADTMNASVASLRAMARFFAAHGVTSFLPTTMTATRAEISAALAAVGKVMGQRQADEARVLGAHVEGPFINPKRCGAQSPEFMRAATPDEYLPWLDGGVVKLMTVAPEMPGAMQLIEDAVARGIAIAIGHTDASYEQAQAAFATGANQCTHTYNAMRGLHHREPGALGAVLANEHVFAQLICDNIHVHAGAMAALYRCKGAGKLAVITDAMEATGEGDGEFTLGAHRVYVRDGVAQLSDGALAGSTLTMDVALRNIMAATGCTLVEASRMCSHTPACAVGIGDHTGRIALGYAADLVVLDDALDVVRTMQND